MTQDLSRRDLLKTVGAVGAGALVGASVAEAGLVESATANVQAAPTARPAGEISELFSTSDVFIPPRGRTFMKFSYDSPSPRSRLAVTASASWSSPGRTPTVSTARG